jgi:hypothetical protein
LNAGKLDANYESKDGSENAQVEKRRVGGFANQLYELWMNSLRLVYLAGDAMSMCRWLEGQVITRVAVSMFLMAGAMLLLYCFGKLYGESKKRRMSIRLVMGTKDSGRIAKLALKKIPHDAILQARWQKKADPLGRVAGRF